MKILARCGLALGLGWCFSPADGCGQDTSFTYQGRLHVAGNETGAEGLFDFRFTFYDAAINWNQVGAALTTTNVPVTNGLFSVVLNPEPTVLDGSPRWLEIAVRPVTNSGDYILLSPRQPLTQTPYAYRAASYDGSIAIAQLPTNVARLDASNQVFSGVVQFNNDSNVFRGVFSGDGSGLTTLPASSTNGLIRVWNIRDYGAVGGDSVADSVALGMAVSNAFKFGGTVFFPRTRKAQEYVFTNRIAVPNVSALGAGLKYSDIAFRGDGIAATGIRLAITNGTWLTCLGNPPSLSDFYVLDSGNPFTTNTVMEQLEPGFPSIVSRVACYGFTNSECFRMGADSGCLVESTDFQWCRVGIRILKYSDGVRINTRGSFCFVAPVVIGGRIPTSPNHQPALGTKVHLVGAANPYGVIIAGGNSRGTVVSGYLESPGRAVVACGYPLDLFPGETNSPIAQVVVRDLITGGQLATNTIPVVELHTAVNELILENVNGGTLVSSTNASAANKTGLAMRGVECSGSFVSFPVQAKNIPSTPQTDIHVNHAIDIYGYDGMTTNRAVHLDRKGGVFDSMTIAGTFSLRTNASPPNVNVGSTPPDTWFLITHTNGARFYVPGWSAH